MGPKFNHLPRIEIRVLTRSTTAMTTSAQSRAIALSQRPYPFHHLRRTRRPPPRPSYPSFTRASAPSCLWTVVSLDFRGCGAIYPHRHRGRQRAPRSGTGSAWTSGDRAKRCTENWASTSTATPLSAIHGPDRIRQALSEATRHDARAPPSWTVHSPCLCTRPHDTNVE